MAKKTKKITKKAAKKSTKKVVKKAAPKKPTKKVLKKAAKKIAKKTTQKKVPKKAVKKVLKKAMVKRLAPETAVVVRSVSRSVTIPEVTSKTASIKVVFSGVSSGNSLITASLNGIEKSLTSSGTITFTGVVRDDIIGIDGSTPGNVKLKIDIDATPAEMNFTGNFNDNFIIN